MPSDPRPDPAPLRVALLRLTIDPVRLATAAAALAEAERARAERFVQAADRARHLLGRALARHELARRLGVPGRTLRFVDDAQGKPGLGDASLPASFNLAHSGDWIVCVTGDGTPVGVDVQEHVPGMARPDDYGPVFGPRERATIDAAHDAPTRIAAFARAWARKEALLKAVGTGLLTRLVAVDIVDGPQGPCWPVPDDAETASTLAGAWTLRDLVVDNAHAGAVAWKATPGTTGAVGPADAIEIVEIDAAALGG
ncbi:MAG: 4'-phosphopantetheinyl transferase family protein [Burkholderiaceae bacterium]